VHGAIISSDSFTSASYFKQARREVALNLTRRICGDHREFDRGAQGNGQRIRDPPLWSLKGTKVTEHHEEIIALIKDPASTSPRNHKTC
jgi:hypothetical protein